jgi:hypothetical protein
VWPVPDEIGFPTAYRFGDTALLMGSSTGDLHASPGELVTFELYWQALGPADTELYTYLHSVDSDVIRRDSPAGLPTCRPQPGRLARPGPNGT